MYYIGYTDKRRLEAFIRYWYFTEREFEAVLERCCTNERLRRERLALGDPLKHKDLTATEQQAICHDLIAQVAQIHSHALNDCPDRQLRRWLVRRALGIVTTYDYCTVLSKYAPGITQIKEVLPPEPLIAAVSGLRDHDHDADAIENLIYQVLDNLARLRGRPLDGQPDRYLQRWFVRRAFGIDTVYDSTRVLARYVPGITRMKDLPHALLRATIQQLLAHKSESNVIEILAQLFADLEDERVEIEEWRRERREIAAQAQLIEADLNSAALDLDEILACAAA